MRMFFSAVSALIVIAWTPGLLGAQAPSTTRAHVEALASPRLEGRLTGSAGEQLASDYLVAELKKIGAKPLPGQADYRVAFDFTAGTRDGGSSISMVSTAAGLNRSFTSRTDVQALSFSDNGDLTGQ